MAIRRSPVSLLAALLTAGLVPAVSRAQVTFTNIATVGDAAPGGGFLLGVGNNPTVGSGGVVGFTASFSGGIEGGILTGTGGALTLEVGNRAGFNAAPGGGFFNGVGGPALSGANLAFNGSVSSGAFGRGIFRKVGGAIATIATNTGATAPGGGTFTGFQSPASGGATVAFRADYAGGTGSRGVFRGNGTSLTTIAFNGSADPFGGTYSDFSVNPAVSGNNVAFRADFTGGNQGIFRGDGATTVPIATSRPGTDAVPGGGNFNLFGPTMSVSGSSVAFTGFFNGFTAVGAFVGDGATLRTVAKSGGAVPISGASPFTNIANPSMSGSNVAFFGNYNGGGSSGIFAELNGVLQKVIVKGDPLFGSTVTGVTFGSFGLSGNTVAFSYSLADGRGGIARANLGGGVTAPEPGTCALACVGVATGLWLRRRR